MRPRVSIGGVAETTMLDWIIIGGGVHGTYLSHVLVNALGRHAEDIRVIDAARQPLANWDRRAHACGMRYLRSPQVHHLDLRSDSLRRFAQRRARSFIGPYQRPALALFRAHADRVIAEGRLARLRTHGCARELAALPGGYRVTTDTDTLRARRILLAPGPGAPARPAWASGIAHVFDSGFCPTDYNRKTVAIVGGGVTGGQLALMLAQRGANVTLITPHGLRQADFDSDPCYLGARCLAGFARASWSERRRLIAAARRPGTVPREVYRAVRAHPRVRVVTATLVDQRDDGVYLADGRTLHTDCVVLATGFSTARPGGALVARAIACLRLATDRAGWPLIAPDLQWRPGLYASGALAQLELGPAASNIAGARMAGRRLVHYRRCTTRRTPCSRRPHWR